MENITSSQYREYKEAFDIFDRDCSGKLSFSELKLVFKALQIEINSREIRRIMHKMDSDGDGEISFEEFLSIMGRRKHTYEEMEKSFKYFDQNSDGYISLEELGQAFHRLGLNYTDKEVTDMFNSVDADRDGRITITEFIQLM